MKPKRRMDEESPEGTDEEKGEAQIAQLETAFLKETLKELGNIFFMGEVNEEAANGLVSSLITYKDLMYEYVQYVHTSIGSGRLYGPEFELLVMQSWF